MYMYMYIYVYVYIYIYIYIYLLFSIARIALMQHVHNTLTTRVLGPGACLSPSTGPRAWSPRSYFKQFVEYPISSVRT